MCADSRGDLHGIPRPEARAQLSFALQLELDDFSLDVQHELDLEGILAVLGPSGSGKSTLLRSLAGIEERAQGRIEFSSSVWLDSSRGFSLPPHRRPVGMVFQDVQLFAHLTVAGNLRYAERRALGSRPELAFDQVAEALDLGPLLGRASTELSGGERQRVALGRTLLAQPRLLLLDEPLAALDASRKLEILPYLQQLYPRFAIPAIFVSHSLDEVALLAERTLVLAKGRIAAAGPTRHVLERLDLAPLSSNAEEASLIEAEVCRQDRELQLTWLELEGQMMSVPRMEHLSVGSKARLVVHARDVSLALERPSRVSIRNILEGTVTAIKADDTTAFAVATVGVGPHQLKARITRASLHELDLEVGAAVFAMLKTVSFEPPGDRH